jgi:hypothetical protein
MTTKLTQLGIASAAILSVVAANAATNDVFVPIEPKPIAKNRISLGYRMGLNITADFRRLGGFGAATDPGPDSGAAVDRNYDNGYNRVDITGNNHPMSPDTTWNWGYQGSSSIQGQNLVLQSASSPSTAVSKDNDDGVNHGFEISYQREMVRKEKWRGGLEAAFGFTTLQIDDYRVLHNEVNIITDTFQLPAGVESIPGYPNGYAGTFEGPGAVIDSSLDAGQRVRSVSSTGATITGVRQLDANIYLIRLGPYIEVPINDKFAVFFNGGLNLAIGDTEFSFRETVAYTDGTRAVRSGSGSNLDVLVGGYVGGGLSYAINEKWGVFTGAQFQTAGRSFNNAGGKESVLDMGKTIVVTVGVSRSW